MNIVPTPRESSFELVRILSILMIVSMHAMAPLFDTSNLLNRELVIAINSVANSGVSLFVLISGYFAIRFRWERLLDIVGLVWFYVILRLALLTFVIHETMEVKDYIPYLFPILGKNLWFITCYVVVYCLSPWLNRMCEVMDRQTFERLLIVLGVFFYVAPTFLVFYEITDDMGKGVVNMALLYLVGRYIRLYGFPDAIKKFAFPLVIGCAVCAFVLNSGLSMAKGTIILRFARDNNLLMLVESVGVFYLFSKIHFVSTWINKAAGYVFALYLSHHCVLIVANHYVPCRVDSLSVWPRLMVVILVSVLCCLVVESLRKKMVTPLLRPLERWLLCKLT